MDRTIRSKVAALARAKEAGTERERRLNEETKVVVNNLEESTMMVRQLERAMKDLDEEKSSAVERWVN